MSIRYLVAIGEFSVSQANALSDGIFLSAVPPLTAWTGLAVALQHRLGKDAYTLNGVAPVIGEAQLHRGHAKYVRYRAGQLADVSARGVQHPTIDDRRTSLNAYLLLDLTSDGPVDKDLLTQALLGLRLAGGVIHPVSHAQSIIIRVFEEDGQTPALTRALCHLPSYFYMLEDAGHLVAAAREHEGWQGFDILTAPMRRWAGDETAEEQKKGLSLPERPAWLPLKGQGRYRPMAVGYQLLEAPQQRLGSRQGFPHAFAEPVFTLIRFRTVASIRKTHNPYQEGNYFWQPDKRGDNVIGTRQVDLNDADIVF